MRIKREDKQQALFAVHRDGTGLRQLTPYSWEVAIKHDWSPDGKLIVLTTNADGVRPSESANLVTIRPDGSSMTDLTGFTGRTENAFAGSFSPDGKQIVFRIEAGDSSSLAVIDRDGGNLRRLTTVTASQASSIGERTPRQLPGRIELEPDRCDRESAKTAHFESVSAGRDFQPTRAGTGFQAGLEPLFVSSVIRAAALPAASVT